MINTIFNKESEQRFVVPNTPYYSIAFKTEIGETYFQSPTTLNNDKEIRMHWLKILRHKPVYRVKIIYK